MEARENRLLSYASTFNLKMLKDGYHKVWATRLARLADAIPDTHGLLINKIWKKLPEIIRCQISPNYTCWNAFQSAIQCMQAGVTLDPEILPEPWYTRQTAGDLHFDLPSNSGFVVKMNCYMPPTWRGPRPDRRPPALTLPPPDKAWDHPIPCPPGIDTVYPSPRSMHHAVHGDVFSPTAPSSLAVSGAKIAKATAKKPKAAPSAETAKATAKKPKATTDSKSKPRKRSRVTKPKDRVTTSNTMLTSYRFTVSKSNLSSPSAPSVAGISSHLAALGVRSTSQKKPEKCTDQDVDHSLYLFPSYLFPSLAEGGSVAECGMELMGIEHDPRSIILDLCSCFLEIEPLLHTSPQIFTNDDWDNIVRVPATSRSFKVVLAFQMQTYTVGFLSNDNLCYSYWYPRDDIELVRVARVPDVVLEYWNWSLYVARWLREQDIHPKWDKRPLSYVISMPGNHPMRGVGRYSSDEIAWRSGVPLYTLWGDVRKDPAKLCAVYLDIRNTVAQSINLNKLCGRDVHDADKSFLLISTQDAVLRYDRTLSVHKQLWTSMSQRKKNLVLKYNATSTQHLSQISHDSDPDAMRHAPWPFDLADLAQALLLHGHMGPAIVADWDQLLEKEGLAATTAEMRTVYASKLPQELTDHQRLSFKPVVDMTVQEKQLLSCIRGGSTNPVVLYFEDRRKLFPSVKSSSSPLSMDLGQAPVGVVVVPDVIQRTLAGTHPAMHLNQPVDVDCPIDANSNGIEDVEVDDLFLGALPLLSDSESEFEDEFEDEIGNPGSGLAVEDDDPFLGALPLLSDSESEFNDEIEIENPGSGLADVDVDIDGLCSQILCDASCWCMGALPLLTDSESEDDDDADSRHRKPYEPDVIDTSAPLSLIRDSCHGKRLATRLYRCTTSPSFHTWTPLKLPRITTKPHPSYQPPTSVVYRQCVDSFREKKTLRSIKQASKLYAVGPMDFCGHAKAVRRGQGWVISLCHWDPTLPDKDQVYMRRAWDALGAWPKGFSKKSRKLVKKAVAFRAESKRLLARQWNSDRDITELDVDCEVSRRKRSLREAAHQKLLQKASDAAVKGAKRKSHKLKSKGRRS
ncbi:hypothetical protein C8R45DRAFT_930180 [Mycena sanguinolenta]|nr:hypothetical protein C8R45DRAFT_930180 [Mycena sanguinolenta]